MFGQDVSKSQAIDIATRYYERVKNYNVNVQISRIIANNKRLISHHTAAAYFHAAVFFIHALVIYPHHTFFYVRLLLLNALPRRGRGLMVKTIWEFTHEEF